MSNWNFKRHNGSLRSPFFNHIMNEANEEEQEEQEDGQKEQQKNKQTKVQKAPQKSKKSDNTPKEFANKTAYKEFVDELIKGADDPKMKQWIDYAFGGKSKDIKIKAHEATAVPVKKLTPTQNFIGLENSIGFPVKEPEKAKDNLTLMLTEDSPEVTAGSPVWIFNGEFIIDGHHRWSQVYAFNPNAKITAINFTSDPDIEPKQALAAVQGVIASTLGEIPIATSKIDGRKTKACNVLEADLPEMLTSAKDFYNSVKTKEEFSDLCEEILKNCDKSGLTDLERTGFKNDNSAGAKVLTYACLRKGNNAIEGAPDREHMPQTGGTDKKPIKPEVIQKKLANGVDDVVTNIKESHRRHGRLFKESEAVYEDVVSTVLEDILNDKLGDEWSVSGIKGWLEEWANKMIDFASKRGISDVDELADSRVALMAHRALEELMGESVRRPHRRTLREETKEYDFNPEAMEKLHDAYDFEVARRHGSDYAFEKARDYVLDEYGYEWYELPESRYEYEEATGHAIDETFHHRHSKVMSEDREFFSEADYDRAEIRELKAEGKIVKRVIGGWMVFDTISDYETWRNQK